MWPNYRRSDASLCKPIGDSADLRQQIDDYQEGSGDGYESLARRRYI